MEKSNTLVWAKLGSWPYWPAIITDMPPALAKKGKNKLCVVFFGSRNYGFVNPHSVVDYSSNKNEMMERCKTIAFKNAIKSVEEYIGNPIMYSENVTVKPIKGKVKVKVEHDDCTEPKVQLEAIESDESRDVASADAHRKLFEEHMKTKANNSAMFFDLQKKNEMIASLQAQNESLYGQLKSLKDENKVLMEESQKANADAKAIKNENNRLTAVVKQLRKGIEGNERNASLGGELAGRANDEIIDQSDSDVFEVEKLLNHRKRKGKTQYLVRWVGFGSSEDCWINENDLNCAALLKEYRNQKNLK